MTLLVKNNFLACDEWRTRHSEQSQGRGRKLIDQIFILQKWEFAT